MNQIFQQETAVSGIILAAGTSSRMGTPKQLLTFYGKPLLHHVVRAAVSSDLSHNVVVLGHRAAEIRNAIDLTRVETVTNRFYKTGQGSSLRAGLAAIPDNQQAALFLLGDQPLISEKIINSILERFHQTQAPLVIPRYHGQRGNPVLIARPLFGSLLKLEGDAGGRELFTEQAHRISYLETNDKAVLTDIDTPDDYKLLVVGEKEWQTD